MIVSHVYVINKTIKTFKSILFISVEQMSDYCKQKFKHLNVLLNCSFTFMGIICSDCSNRVFRFDRLPEASKDNLDPPMQYNA